MNNHPLFKGFVNSGIVSTGAALGFSVCVVSSIRPIYPLSAESIELVKHRLDQHGGADGFYRVACWEVPGAHMAAYAKPLTDVAMALYLVGLGWIAQTQHALHEPRYRYSHAAVERPKGWADSLSQAAERGERDALEHGQTEYKTHRVRSPLASWLYTGAQVLQDLELEAYRCAGDEVGHWPKVDTGQIGQFASAQALLVDGFAWHTDNMPTFSICDGPAANHKVWSSG